MYLPDLDFADLKDKAISAKMPPSPLLFARITKKTYFKVTTNMNAQKIMDKTPMMDSGVSAIPAAGSKQDFKAYKGLVPMSPKTTPMAIKDKLAREP
jgi:hypothetical protein